MASFRLKIIWGLYFHLYTMVQRNLLDFTNWKCDLHFSTFHEIKSMFPFFLFKFVLQAWIQFFRDQSASGFLLTVNTNMLTYYMMMNIV